MKPHGKSVYAVLLLDNRGLRSFTVRVFWLKVLCFLFLLLFAAAGLGGYLAHKYRTQYIGSAAFAK